MKKAKKTQLDFVIDKLTNSIQNIISGDSFQTEISRLTKSDIKLVTKKKGWNFNWKKEFDDNTREVYKLTIVNNSSIIQGLMSFTVKMDHIYMDLLKVHRLIWVKTNCMQGFPEIWSLLHAKYHFKEVLKDLFLLQPKQNLLSTTKKL